MLRTPAPLIGALGGLVDPHKHFGCRDMLVAFLALEVMLLYVVNVALIQKLTYHQPSLYAELGKPHPSQFSLWNLTLAKRVRTRDARAMGHGIPFLVRCSTAASFIIPVTALAAMLAPACK